MRPILPCRCPRTCWVLCGLAFAWSVMFPEDLQALMAPIEIGTAAIAPGLYALAAIALACWTYWNARQSGGASE